MTETIRLTVNEDDAERLGIEQEAEYRTCREGDLSLSFIGVDGVGPVDEDMIGCSTLCFIVNRKPTVRHYIEQLRKIGWRSPVRQCYVEIRPDGYCCAWHGEGDTAIRLIATPDIFPDPAVGRCVLYIDGAGYIYEIWPE